MEVKRLNKNKDGYRGETIDIHSVLSDIKQSAQKHNWVVECFYENCGCDFFGLIRKSKEGNKNLYISAGIHGDEPAGPLAVLELLKENDWKENINIWICPVLNPVGFTFNSRCNEEGIDLNRDYKHPEAPETSAHLKWLKKQPEFDMTLALHEDWESSGFYLYDHGHLPRLAHLMVEEVSKIFPINTDSAIEDYKAQDGIIDPKVNIEKRKDWLETFYLMSENEGDHYVIEAGSDYPLESRVAALVTAVKTAIQNLS